MCSTRLRSVRYSKDLMIRSVSVAEVFGRARFVKTSEISGSWVFDIQVEAL